MKKNNYLTLALGIGMFVAGLLLIKNEQLESLLIPYLLIGFGAGLFGNGFSDLIVTQVMKKNPELAKEDRINRKDERNQLINARSKEKAFDLATYLLGALMLAYALMKENLAIVLSLVAVYLFIQFYALYWRFRLEKEL